MKIKDDSFISVRVSVKSSLDKAWKVFTEPGHIINWNHASADWHTPRAENDLRPGGKFRYRLESRDGIAGFYFEGTFTHIEFCKSIEYLLPDGRRVNITFETEGGETSVTESFEPESVNAPGLQRSGWQSILDTYKEYVETV